MYVVAGAVTVILNDDIASSYDYDAAALLNINARFSTVASTFDDIATALLLVTLVEIGNGFLYILTQTRTGLQKGLRWATISAAAVLVVLSIARLGFLNAAWTKYLSDDDEYYQFYGFSTDQKTARKLGSAIVILFWIMTIPLIAFASYVVHRVRTVPLLRSVSRWCHRASIPDSRDTDATFLVGRYLSRRHHPPLHSLHMAARILRHMGHPRQPQT
jgi:hypothetical protein